MFRHLPRFCSIIFLLIFVAFTTLSQTIPTPKSILGFQPTDDKTFADWSQVSNYFAKLDAASPRVKVQTLGKTTLGKPFIVAFISSEKNILGLEKYKKISQKLANPQNIKSETELNSLLKEGKTIVSISCSIHSTEVVATQMSMLLAYELANAKDAETLEILNNTILILIPSMNPDGVDIVSNWYRKTLNTKSEGSSPPELYHAYAGHDDNRDWFMMNLPETRLVTQLFWKEWFPQLVYDIHQQGQNSSRFIIPPFFDPPNPRVAPSILREVGLIGYKMAADLQAAGIAGVATNSTYDTWWHGGFRSAPYFHNSIGILSEAASSNLMSPVTITEENLRKNQGVRGLTNLLEPATNYPDIWRGGLWRPADIARIEMIASRGLLEMAAKFRPRYLKNFYNLGKANLERKPDEPQALVVNAGQPNAEEVSRFLEILMVQGIEVHQMTSELYLAMDEKKQAEFHEMPLGSFLIFVNQAQKNNVLSLFEKQVYPNRRNANGDAEAPYDVAGWTLPLQMGVSYDAVWNIKDLEKYRATLKPVANINQARSVLNLSATKESFAKLPNPLKLPRKIALYKGFTGSMDEGWTRLVFDTYQIPYNSATDKTMREGNLKSQFDAIVLPSDSERSIVNGLSNERYPEELTGGIGEKGTANLKKFVEDGGTLICFDASCGMVIKLFDLPIKNVLTGLKRNEFYCPGSILQLDVDTSNSLAKGLKKETSAYFISSSAFEITDSNKVKSVAKYADKNLLLSGWVVGEKHLNGKTALAEVNYGKGKIILFAFRPQHRGQTFGTFPFIFNALEH